MGYKAILLSYSESAISTF